MGREKWKKLEREQGHGERTNGRERIKSKNNFISKTRQKILIICGWKEEGEFTFCKRSNGLSLRQPNDEHHEQILFFVRAKKTDLILTKEAILVYIEKSKL